MDILKDLIPLILIESISPRLSNAYFLDFAFFRHLCKDTVGDSGRYIKHFPYIGIGDCSVLFQKVLDLTLMKLLLVVQL